MRFNDAEDEEAFGERLQHGDGDAHKYDAVFVDEAQDFCKSWFLCSKLALKETDDGDLLIVGDGSQSLYLRRPFTWKEGGVNAVGRTINTRFDLDKNYRNTREIIKFRQIASKTILNRASRLLDLTQTSHYDLAQLLKC